MKLCKLRLEWDHTADIIATIFNTTPGVKKSDMITAESINPYREVQKSRVKSIPVSSMARGFGAE